MDRNLALEIVRVTEASALAASRWVGKGDAVAADSAAVQAMHTAFNSIAFSGRVALGEGERGMVPQLFVGQTLGHGGDSNLDLAIDALECTRSVAFGRSNAMTVVAMAPEACFFLPPSQYLYKIAVGPEGAEAVDLNLSVEDNLYRVAEAKSYSIADLTVVILDRERHQELIATVRKVGARIHLIPDGDVAAAIATAMPGSGVDLLLGVGSSTAAVLSAAALQCLGGEIQARLAPTDAAEKTRLKEAGFNDPDTILRKNDMVRGDNVMFAATGITDGDVLNGVSFRSDGATTHSLVMRSKSRTRRFIVCEHYFEDNPSY